jgi:predicted acylesterase/phospholipase RssA
MQNQSNTFKIGLCMAGAVSAGAYTAGVLDYLIEALEDWQRRKDQNQPNTPSHRVEIPVIGGASAGGMTAIIAAAALQDPFEPLRTLPHNILEPQAQNPFYHAWVDQLGPDMLSMLLNTSDISKQNGIKSALNSDFIDKIADKALKVSSNPPVPRPYLPHNTKLFVTLSNLEGMDFSVTFKSNSPAFNRYKVSAHTDFACFKLAASELDYSNDGWIPLNFKTQLNAELARQAAMATGAFPLGLKARTLSRKSQHMNDLSWLFHITKSAKNPFPNQNYHSVHVDGGMINNEPFDKIRELLCQETGQSPEQAQDYQEFKSTVLMIDPFPSEPGQFNSSTDLLNIMGNTLGAMLGQARLKDSTLIDAMDSSKAGQFLIAPVRHRPTSQGGEAIEGKKAIACGALGGFGGFISKEFRIHDYFLGRANCEIFLRHHFTVPQHSSNPIFQEGYAHIEDKQRFTSRTDGGMQIIPIFSEPQAGPYMPQFANGERWPSIAPQQLRGYRSKIKARVQKTLFHLLNLSPMQRFLLWIGAKVVLNGKIADSLLSTVQKSLQDQGLLQK